MKVWEQGHFVSKIIDKLANETFWIAILFSLLEIVYVWIVGELINIVLKFLIKRTIRIKSNSMLHSSENREATIEKLLLSTVKYVIRIIVFLWVLSILGVPFGSVLTGAGVIGIAIGFGMQNLIKDIISGFIIIFEDQFTVGDTVQINDFEGTVEEIGLRTTIVNSEQGHQFIIPNGNILSITNLTKFNSVKTKGKRND